MKRMCLACFIVLIGIFVAILCPHVSAGEGETVEKATLRVGVEDRKDLSLTIYNSGIALVKDTRFIQFSKGLNLAEISDLSANMDATSVSFTSLTDPDGLSTVEHNFDYGINNRQAFLEKYIGKDIWLVLDGIRISAKLISVDGQGRLVVDLDGRIILDPPGSIELPQLPSKIITHPTLTWYVESDWIRRHEVEIAYLTSGLNWSADYVCTLDDKDEKCVLTGWVTLNNNSETTYRDAHLRLIAGNIHMLPGFESTRGTMKTMMVAESTVNHGIGFEGKSGFEYYTYSLPGKTTVVANQLKQVQLLEASNVPLKKLYILERPVVHYVYEKDVQPGQIETVSAKAVLEFINNKESDLGIPLPAGRVRVYKALVDKSMDFIGEDAISHTPRDETVRLYVGDAFDVIGERMVTDFKIVEKSREEAYCIKVRNKKDEDIKVAVIERFYGDWTISSPVPHEKPDANTVVFNVDVPKGSEVEILFRVHIRLE